MFRQTGASGSQKTEQSPLGLLREILSRPFLLSSHPATHHHTFGESIFLEAGLICELLYSQMNIWRSSGGIRLSFMGLANTATTPTEFFASMSGSRWGPLAARSSPAHTVSVMSPLLWLKLFLGHVCYYSHRQFCSKLEGQWVACSCWQ